MPPILDAEVRFVEEPSLLVCKISYLHRRMWAIYCVEPTSYELVHHRVAHKDAPPAKVAEVLMDLLEHGVDRLPGSKVLAMDIGTAGDILEATALQVDVMAGSFRIRNDLEHVRHQILFPDSNVIQLTPRTSPSSGAPIVLATDASRRAGGNSAYGWIALRPGSRRPPEAHARKSKASKIAVLEASAIFHGLLSINTSPSKPIHIMSDSKTALRIFNTLMMDTRFESDLWKIYPHANARDIQKYSERVTTYWIRGHSGNPANEAVDAMVRGATLASTNDGVDLLAMQGIEQIIRERKVYLASLSFEELMEGAEPFHERYNLSQAA